MVKGKGYQKEVDWWSFGAVLYEMLVGVQPFHHANHQRLLDNILFKDLTFPDTVSKNARDLLTKLLERNPTRRLGFGPNGAENIKAHKFFKWIDWEQAKNRELKPPICPKLNFESDSRNFDKEFTSLRVDETEQSPSRSIAEKKSTYIRDFTYYHQPDANSKGIDVEKVLELNLARTQNQYKSRESFEAIVEEGKEESSFTEA